MKLLLSFVALTALLCAHAVAAEKKPLKVFILAGQSNMEGHARVETFDYIGDDPATAPLLKMMRGADGKPAVCDHVWISYLTGRYDGSANGEGIGKLTAGFGARGDNPTQDGGKIGPEFTFGLTMDAALKEPVLIIKTAWGGRSLNTEFRPPSAGPYEFSEAQLAQMQKQGKDIAAEKAAKAKETGRFYRYMVEHVKSVLADPKRVCPAYDPAAGYEIAGFVWFQGFNDLVDGNTYPTGADGKTRDYTKYGVWLADFIRDVRKDLDAPKMPFVIGVLGVDGLKANAGNARFPQGHGGSGGAAGVQRQCRRRGDRAVLVGGTRGHRQQAREGAADELLPEQQGQGPPEHGRDDDRRAEARVSQEV